MIGGSSVAPLPRWITAIWGCCAALLFALLGGCAPQIQPQIGIERLGEPHPPLPKNAQVKVYREGEPNESYREVGKVTATCPVEHWSGGYQKKGLPICLDGLRQGARKLGAQAVVEVKSKRIRPPGSPDTPWLILSGVAVRLTR